MTAAPLLSVVVAVFNANPTLGRCLESITAQTYPQVELIVIDGGSTDGTVETLTAFGDKIAYWESRPDRGIYHAWNKALDHVNGQWICFLGADDFFWAPDVLAKLADHLPPAASPIRVVYGRTAVLSKSGGLLRYEGMPWKASRRGLAWSLTLPHPGLLHRYDLFTEHGRFDEMLRIVGDYDFLLRELKPVGPSSEALFISDVVAVGFQHGGVSHSPRAMAMMLDEIRRVRVKHHLPIWALPSKVRLKMVLCAWAFRIVGDSGFRLLADALRRLRGKPSVWKET